MVDKTLEALITECEDAIGQSPGINVQVYAQGTIVNLIQDAYLTFVTDSKVRWKRYKTFQNYTLDGSTGRCTVDPTITFKDYMNIHAVYPGDSDRPLSALPGNTNPARITGNRPRFYSADSSKLIRVYPITAVGQITIVGQSLTLPPFNLDSVVPFDYLAIKYYVAWQYLNDDGANPAAAERNRMLFQNRWDQLKKSQESEPVSLTGRGTQIPTTWYD